MWHGRTDEPVALEEEWGQYNDGKKREMGEGDL